MLFLLKSVVTMLIGAALCVLIVGFEYRDALPLMVTLVTMIGLLGFCLSLGYTVYTINTRLATAQQKLSRQTEQAWRTGTASEVIQC